MSGFSIQIHVNTEVLLEVNRSNNINEIYCILEKRLNSSDCGKHKCDLEPWMFYKSSQRSVSFTNIDAKSVLIRSYATKTTTAVLKLHFLAHVQRANLTCEFAAYVKLLPYLRGSY